MLASTALLLLAVRIVGWRVGTIDADEGSFAVDSTRIAVVLVLGVAVAGIGWLLGAQLGQVNRAHAK